MSASPGEHLATLIRIRERLNNLSKEVTAIATAVDIEINSFADASLRAGALQYAPTEEDDE